MATISKDRLKLLIQKYLNADLRESETRELNDFGAAYPQLWLLIARLQDKGQFARDVEELQSIDTEKALAGSLSQIRRLQPGQGLLRKLLLQPAAIVIGIVVILTLTGITVWKLRGSVTQPGSLAVVYRTVTQSGMGQYTVSLPDHSKIWLNNGATLRYPSTFTGKTREVDFAGEGYFEITGDASTPFLVHLKDGLLLHVLGTSFNISAYPGEKITRTTVLTGSVKISNAFREQVIMPLQQSVIHDNKEWDLLPKVDSISTIEWKNDYFIFKNTPPAIAVQQLSKHFGIPIEIEAPDKLMPCNASIRKDLPLLTILDILGFHHRLEGKKLVLFR